MSTENPSPTEATDDQDDLVRETDKEIVAFRKAIYRMADVDPADPEDDPSIFEAVDRAEDRMVQLEDRLEELEAKIEGVEQTANSALGVAQSASTGPATDGGGQTKIAQARNTARNELVKRALLDTSSSSGASVEVGDVQTMLKPGTEVRYQTVKDAFGDLAETWTAFRETENDDGNRALRVRVQDLTKDLVGTVEVDLDRDDLTKRLMSRQGSGGA